MFPFARRMPLSAPAAPAAAHPAVPSRQLGDPPPAQLDPAAISCVATTASSTSARSAAACPRAAAAATDPADGPGPRPHPLAAQPSAGRLARQLGDHLHQSLEQVEAAVAPAAAAPARVQSPPAPPPARALLRLRANGRLRPNQAAARLLCSLPDGAATLLRAARGLLLLARAGGRATSRVRLPAGAAGQRPLDFHLQVVTRRRPGGAQVQLACRLRPWTPRADRVDGAPVPASAHRRAAALEHLPYALWLSDAGGNVTYQNPRAQAWLAAQWPGAPSEPTGGAGHGNTALLRGSHPEDREALAEHLRARRGQRQRCETRCRLHVPGHTTFRWHTLRSQPQLDTQQVLRGWVTTLHDDHEAYSLREDLRVAACLRDNFLRVASHELSTPLTSLQLSLQLAQARVKRAVPCETTRAPVAEPLRRALDETARLVELVSDLLDIKRLQTGKFLLRRSQANLATLLQDIFARLNKPMQDAGCSLDFHGASNVVGHWDVVRLQQVFFHLLHNVIKYAPGCCVHVTCGGNADGAWVAFEDEGPGIPAGLRKKIFSLFERATEVRGTSGLGMGLYLCRRIIHAHHGNLRLVSRNGRGAKFVVQLPRAPAEQLTTCWKSAAKAQAAAEARTSDLPQRLPRPERPAGPPRGASGQDACSS